MRGVCRNNLAELRRTWNLECHGSNVANWRCCNNINIKTPRDYITFRLLCEMRRFKQEPGEPEARAVTFKMFPFPSIPKSPANERKPPRLLCASACDGIAMQSSDLLRFDGKPGSIVCGAVTYSVDEDDLIAELREPAADSTEQTADAYIPDDTKGVANAFRRLDGGGALNFLFVLYVSPDSDIETEIASNAEDWAGGCRSI
eukprot:Skav203363  [mRNA]  locus=scaffold2649:30855:31460:+ [translate_table: standard]